VPLQKIGLKKAVDMIKWFADSVKPKRDRRNQF
jgi:hypothetical protein